jgi:PAS domain S-box-containing protein
VEAKRDERVREAFRSLEPLFEHSPDAVIILDKHLTFVRVNKVYAKSRGRSVSDFPGRKCDEFFPGADTQVIFENVVRTKTPCQITAKSYVFPEHKEWGVTYWDWTLAPVLDARGELEFLIFSLRDVTMRKRMERELQENEERYRSLVTATAQIVWTTNPKGEIVQELPTWQGFTGQTREQYFRSGWLNALHPDDRDRVSGVWANAVAARSVYEAEYRLRRDDGQYRYVIARGVPVLGKRGAIREWVGTCRDITERKENERRRDFTNALLALFAQKPSSKEYLDAVVETIRKWSGSQAVGIRVVDSHHNIPYQSWAGFEPRFIELEECLSLQHDTCCCVRAVLQGFEEQDLGIVTPGGSFRCDDIAAYLWKLTPERQARFRGNCVNFGFASVAVVPIWYREKAIGAVHMADKRPGQFPATTIEFIEAMAPLIGEAIHRFQAEAELAHYRERLEELVRQRTNELETANARLQVEITERKRAQEILQETARELERSNRDLEQFAYVASHDLQEPLRAVGGFVRLLEHRFPDNLDAKALEYIDGAAQGAARMERLITDLLTFSRVGSQPGAFLICDFNVLLRDALHNLDSSILANQAQVHSQPLPSLPADPTQIVMLFQNLIGNALKFRSEQTPEIHVDAQAEPGRWVFRVRDNGIGIDAQYFDRIFQIFQRLHTRKAYPGTGIGLAICKRIVEQHGGAIWLESQPEQGSTFYFSIPKICPIREPVV